MNLNLRQAVMQRVQDKSSTELIQVIEESIGGDEHVLPGLGVLFEVIWKNCEETIQIELASTLKNHLTH
ncbi:MAG: small, acid-soluble spore protein [Bacilli bacterium]|jgi:small acid-soluble spore protein I (minor)|nr:small, acid-soluble spore protein [Bacilli bacterium]